MIAAATLHALVGILEVKADELTAAAHRVVESHGLEHARASLQRAARLRAYSAEIRLHLIAEGLAAEYSAPAAGALPATCPACRFPL